MRQTKHAPIHFVNAARSARTTAGT